MPNNRATKKQIKICEAWMQSGLSKMEFCRQHHLNRSSFYKWLKQLPGGDSKKIAATSKNITIKDEPIKFLKVCNAVPQRNFTLEPCCLEIALTNGINFKVGITQSDLSNLLQELIKWK